MLEDRRLLAAEIGAIWADHEPFRFIAGPGMPAVVNTYRADVSGDVTAVTFSVGGLKHTDADGSDGWSA